MIIPTGTAHDARVTVSAVREVEPVACPFCRFFQPQMVTAARSRLFPWWRIALFWAIAHYGAGFALSLALPEASMLFLSLPGLATIALLLAQRLRARFAFQSFQTRDAALALLQAEAFTAAGGA